VGGGSSGRGRLLGSMRRKSLPQAFGFAAGFAVVSQKVSACEPAVQEELRRRREGAEESAVSMPSW
jgi:hypothetical protein